MNDELPYSCPECGKPFAGVKCECGFYEPADESYASGEVNNYGGGKSAGGWGEDDD